jgi:hypothetical protein
MTYLGSPPSTQSFAAGTDTFNGDGTTTAFTLTRNVATVNDILVIVNNVEQQPSNYSVSSNILTFSTAPSSGTSNIYVRYLSTNITAVVPQQGTVNLASFSATGTPSSSTYLRGDNTWATISSGSGQQQMSWATYPTTVFNSTGTPMANTGTGTFNWTCPTGVTRVTVSVVGGGGGANTSSCATNGSAGGIAIGTYTVTPGTVYAVTVGVGGTGATSAATNGGSSSFSSFCSATGGLAGNGTSAAPVTGSGTGGNIRNSPAFYYSTMIPLHVPSFNGGIAGTGNAVNNDSVTTASYTWTIGSRSAAGAGGSGSYPSGGVTGLVLITWVG